MPERRQAGSPTELSILAAAVRGQSKDDRADDYAKRSNSNRCRHTPENVRFRLSVLAGVESGLLCSGDYGFLAHVGKHACVGWPAQTWSDSGSGAGRIECSFPAPESRAPGVV